MASYKLVLDRMVGVHPLHKNVAIVAAGNLETDGAIVTPMSTAMQSRLIHLEVEANLKEWIDWANAEGFDHRITSYLGYRPDHFYNFSPEHTDKTYASPRTWDFMDKLLKVSGKTEREHLPLFAGTVGEGVAREFFGFCGIQERLPTIEKIIASPMTTEVPNEPSVQFAITGAIAANANTDNVEALMKYVKRLPAEFQVVCVRNTIRRNKSLLASPAVVGWVSTTSAELM